MQTQECKSREGTAAQRPDMSVTIAGVSFKNPVMTASGTFGSGMEYSDFVDLNRLGAVVTKGVSNVPWPGNPTPRVAEVYGGMLNAIGLQNPGIDVFVERDLSFLEQFDTRVIVNVCGHSQEEYLEVVERLQDEKRVDLLEINVSCPNVKQGAIAFGTHADSLYDITSKIKKAARQPIVMKLTPNVTSIAELARAAEAGGADAISLINTITGMKIDVERQRFVLANKTGGMSGPAIHPVAVRMVYEAAGAVSIPVIGMGGVQSAEDALELMLAGATAVAVGAANFHDPAATVKVAEGMEDYAKRHHLASITELIGAVH
jgi:dihydroorotate dehydrogenase (NAD+) catalytic subunit